jgi:GNAT superfamily N-acetyltransferase
MKSPITQRTPQKQSAQYRRGASGSSVVARVRVSARGHSPGTSPIDSKPVIRECRDDERETVLQVINLAANAYRGVIPADRWREPYMPAAELDDEIAAGVVFWGYESDGAVVGVMGIQDLGEVDLIRHAYVLPTHQRCGVGAALLRHLRSLSDRRMLVGTWAAADWAIRFYERHGFELVGSKQTASLLRSYWTIPERQIETSVVLANPALRDVAPSD